MTVHSSPSLTYHGQLNSLPLDSHRKHTVCTQMLPTSERSVQDLGNFCNKIRWRRVHGCSPPFDRAARCRGLATPQRNRIVDARLEAWLTKLTRIASSVRAMSFSRARQSRDYTNVGFVWRWGRRILKDLQASVLPFDKEQGVLLGGCTTGRRTPREGLEITPPP